MSTVQALLLKFRQHDDDNLDQRMDDEYIQTFAPRILELRRVIGYTTAYILPIADLLEDQRALLFSRGAKVVDAEIVTLRYEPLLIGVNSFRRPIDKLQMFNDVCVFNHYAENRTTQIEAYRVPHTAFESLVTSHLRFGLRYGSDNYGSGGYVIHPYGIS